MVSPGRWTTPHPFAFHHLWLALLLMLIAAGSVLQAGRPAVRRMFDLLYRWGMALDSFDAKTIDGFAVGGAGRLALAISQVPIWCDAWLVEGPVNVGARAIWAVSIPVRMMQSGLVSGYMLDIVIGLVGFLGYCLYLVHHTIR
jgi:hypothetical protein